MSLPGASGDPVVPGSSELDELLVFGRSDDPSGVPVLRTSSTPAEHLACLLPSEAAVLGLVAVAPGMHETHCTP
jgi:hypothetical protein